MLIFTSTLAVWALDPDTGDCWQIDSGKGVYYGISFTEDRLFIGARQAAYGSDQSVQQNVILVYDRALRLKNVLAPRGAPIRDLHQILVAGRSLYVTSTYDDTIAILDLSDRRWTEWRPLPARAGAPDEYHVNSLLAAGESLWLAGKRPKPWVAEFDRAGRQLKRQMRLGRGTHNVWLDDGVPGVCSSDEGALVWQDGRRRMISDGAWTRGYCRLGDRIFVGLSEVNSRENRAQSDCCLVELDADHAPVRAWHLPGWGMLHDVRALNTADASHNGVRFALDRARLDLRFRRQRLSAGFGPFKPPPA